MNNVKKLLLGAAIITGFVAGEIIIGNLTGFVIPEATLAGCGAILGMSTYKHFAKKIDAPLNETITKC